MPATGPRDAYERAILRDGRVHPFLQQDSAATLGLAQADGLLLRPAGSPAAKAGDRVSFLPF